MPRPGAPLTRPVALEELWAALAPRLEGAPASRLDLAADLQADLQRLGTIEREAGWLRLRSGQDVLACTDRSPDHLADLRALQSALEVTLLGKGVELEEAA